MGRRRTGKNVRGGGNGKRWVPVVAPRAPLLRGDVVNPERLGSPMSSQPQCNPQRPSAAPVMRLCCRVATFLYAGMGVFLALSVAGIRRQYRCIAPTRPWTLGGRVSQRPQHGWRQGPTRCNLSSGNQRHGQHSTLGIRGEVMVRQRLIGRGPGRLNFQRPWWFLAR